MWAGGRRVSSKWRKEEAWFECYGEKYENRGNSVNGQEFKSFTVGSGNAHYLSKKGSPKLITLQDEIKGNTVQGLSEHNTNFSKVPQQDQLKERFRKVWRKSKTRTSWIRSNDWKQKGSHQPGGVAIMTNGGASDFMHESGEDKRGLARWVWMKFEGRSEVKTAIIQIYRPVKNQKGESSVYVQQQSRLKEGEEVLNKFDTDLLEQVDELLIDGFRIIVMGDFNMDVRDNNKKLVQELAARGIKERITGRYGKEGAPNTHVRGSNPIDGIFGSDELEMVRGGYRGGNPALSDHRFAWVEFTYDSILGEDRGEAYSPGARKLQLEYKKVTTSFIKLLMKQMNEHKLLEKAEALWERVKEKDTLTTEEWDEYEQLDQQFERAVESADNGCRKLHPNDIEFSPEVKEAIGTLAIWKEIEKKLLKGKPIRGKWLRSLKNKYKTTHTFSTKVTLTECKNEVKTSWENFNRIREQAPELRESFIDSLIKKAEQLKTKEGEKKVKDLRNMKDKERKRDAHKRIGAATGKFKSKGVRYIHGTDENGNPITITDKPKVEKGIMKANQEKLHQCNERTPLRQQPLVDLLTKYDYNTWESFLQGEIPIPEGIEEGTRAYLEIYHNMENNDIDILHTTEGLKKAWSKAKEKTSAAPGPIHYGTMKVMKWCLPMAKFQTIMSNIPLKTSKTPAKWSEDVEAMLLKKKDDYRPEKLRRIGLLNCAFNMNNKHIGRAAMRHAEELGQLAVEQYGSRNNLSAEKHALNKRLTLDIMRVTKTPGVLIANDAKSCYDRILHFATYAALRRAGIPKEAVISMVHTLRTMKHRVRTGYGDSEDYYGGEEDSDQHGATQGNGAGPAIWALVSSPLLDILREKGYGAKFLSPIKKEFFHLCGFAFVDDTDTIQTGEQGTSSEELLVEAQDELDLWENLIRATGGAIEGDKSDYTVINWSWKQGKATYEKMNEDATITVLNSDGIRERLKQLPADEARRTLGVWQAANGQETTQVEKMKEKANEWANEVYKSNLTKSDIAMGVKTSLYPSITYGLLATAMTEAEANEIFKPIREKVLPKMKICRSAPAILVHGPEEYGGLEIKDLYVLQGIAHIKALIDEGETNSTTGKLLRNLIEQHIMELGLSTEPTEWPLEVVQDIMTKTWFKNTLQFMEESKIKMYTGMKSLQKWTTQDSFIMDDVVQYGVKGKQLASFNRCRIHLQAATLSDISLGNGKEISQSALEVRYSPTTSGEAYTWPQQPRPPKSDINEWQKVLQEVYGVGQRYKQWPQQCGSWTQDSVQYAKWRYESDAQRLYEKTEDGKWAIWSNATRRGRATRQGYYKKTDLVVESIDSTMPIAKVFRRPRAQSVRLDSSSPIERQQERQEANSNHSGDSESESSFDSIGNQEQDANRRQLPTLERTLRETDGSLIWALQEMKLPNDEGAAIAEIIKAGNGRCMSDGSLKELFGTSAFTFLIKEDSLGYGGMNIVPGNDDDQSSYRSELCGILGNILVINAICKHNGVAGDYTVQVGCDSESALWNCFGANHVTTKMASFDLVKAIRYQIDKSPIKFKSKWVKAHQDDTKGVLDTWALANIECDNEATRMWNKSVKEYGKQRSIINGHMPGEEWIIYTEDEGRISNNIDSQLYSHALKNYMIGYWEGKERIEPGQGKDVDWKSHNKAMKSFGGRKVWITKHCSGWAGSGIMMTKWGKRDSAKCPRCDTDESTQHVIQCQTQENMEQFKESMEPLKDWLIETTSPRIASAVRTHMNAYQRNVKVNGFRTRNERMQKVSRCQDKMGIRSFGEGFISNEWKYAQEKHYGGEDAASKSERWTAKLIQKIWEVSWDMWQSRNYLLHYNKEVRDELFVERMNVDIEVLWSEGRESKVLFDPERKFFMVTLESLLKKEEYNKVRWIEVAERYLDPDTIAAREESSQGVLLRWLQKNRTVDDGNETADQPQAPRRQYVDIGTPIAMTQQRIQWSPQPRVINVPSPSGMGSVVNRKRNIQRSTLRRVSTRQYKIRKLNDLSLSGIDSVQQSESPVNRRSDQKSPKKKRALDTEDSPVRRFIQQVDSDESTDDGLNDTSVFIMNQTSKEPTPAGSAITSRKRQRENDTETGPTRRLFQETDNSSVNDIEHSSALPPGESHQQTRKRQLVQKTLPWAQNKRHKS